MHRFVCEFVLWIAVSVGIAFVSAIVEGHTHSQSGRTMLNLLGVLGLLGWTTRELAKLRNAISFIRFPSVGLGQWVTGKNAKFETITGFVLDAALDPGVQLIQEPRGHQCRDISRADQSVPLANRDSLAAVERPRPLCEKGCEFWVPDCDVGLGNLEAAAAAKPSTPLARPKVSERRPLPES